MVPTRFVGFLGCVRSIALLGLLSLVALWRPAVALSADVDFNRDIRPILAQNCLKCHGVDDKARKGGLRLDLREGVMAAGKGGRRAVVPGKPGESELVRRIITSDEDDLMPPPGTKLVLTAAQKATLQRWIEQGAPYASHWAYVPPMKLEPPAVKRVGWERNAIDRFVLARLEAMGLSPSAEADRYTLVRRVYLDLVGLPPTPAEADAFVKDASPEAYETLVDRLLAMPQYGERWARRWLDLARYADTNGYEKDRPRSIWPWRDWVIQAINADMPFDQFTIEQIAGDMLPGATPQQRVATGFHRNTMINEEGGIDPLEYRYHAMVDRVHTTATTWLGMTMACAQCHTHKYDPITQKDYYRFMALMNNADEPEMETGAPLPEAERVEIQQRIDKLLEGLPEKFLMPAEMAAKAAAAATAAKATPKKPVPAATAKPPKGPSTSQPATQAAAKPITAAQRRAAAEAAYAAWEAEAAKAAVKWTIVRPTAMKTNMPILTQLGDGSILGSGDITKSDTYELTLEPGIAGITAIRVEALPHESLPRRGPGMISYEGPIGDFCLSEITLEAAGQKLPRDRAAHSFAAGQFTASAAIDGNPQTGWMINGGQGRAHAAIFGLASPTAAAGPLKLTMLFERHFAASLGRFRIAVTTDPRAGRSAVLAPEAEEILAADERRAGQRATLWRHWLLTTPQLAEARRPIEALQNQLSGVRGPTTLVLKERPAGFSRPTHLHHRGEFLQPRERVDPGVPAFLPGLEANAPVNRAGLAQWLVSRQNPLTARVTVNRQWSAFFGRGLVRTTEDFGFQGELPSHPELLDWLAVEFMDQGWSMKKLHRTIVTSATYRQASKATGELLFRDPQNVWLARGPRFRAEAEMIRDGALKAAGLLSAKIGGPSVYPPQPASVTTEGTYGPLQWKASTGEERYRRSLYTFAKRTAPFAAYQTFDAPSGEACTARRECSNTPLQALTLLNDALFLEAAQALGQSVAGAKLPDEQKAAELFRRCLTRPPAGDELQEVVAFARSTRVRLQKKELDAARIGGAGDGDPMERATWTAVARAVLNLDEMIVKP